MTTPQLQTLLESGYTIRRGADWRRWHAVGEWQLFNPDGEFVRRVSHKAYIAALDAGLIKVPVGKGINRE